MPRLNIPSRYRNGLSRINSISDIAFAELGSALGSLRSLNIDSETVEKLAASTPSIGADDLDLLLETLLAMQLARAMNQELAGAFSDDVIKELEGFGPNQVRLSDSERQKFSSRLRTLFGIESLALVAKARYLQTEHGHVFLNGRIVTDLRAVFRGPPDEIPLGMVLFHTLKLSYVNHENNGERSTFFIALDERDVAALKRLLERAEAKARTLRSRLEKAGIDCLDVAGKI